MGRFRYWSTHRPINIGTYPKEYGVVEIANFRRFSYVPEIGRQAFGFIDFESELPKSEQDHYDLRPEIKVCHELDRLARTFAKASARGDMKTIGRVIEKAYELDLIDDESELLEVARPHMGKGN